MTKGTGSPCRISDHPLITLNTSEHPTHTAQHTWEGAAGANGTVTAAGALGGEHGWGGEHVHVGHQGKARNSTVWRKGGNATRSGGMHEHEPPAGSQVAAVEGVSHAGYAGLEARLTLHPTPHTPHPQPYTPNATPYTLHPQPYPTASTLHPQPCTLNPTLQPQPFTLNPAPSTLYPQSCSRTQSSW